MEFKQARPTNGNIELVKALTRSNDPFFTDEIDLTRAKFKKLILITKEYDADKMDVILGVSHKGHETVYLGYWNDGVSDQLLDNDTK